MTTPTPSMKEVEHEYRKLVELTAKGIPSFAPLHEFLNTPNDKAECKITSIEFDKQKTRVKPTRIEHENLLKDLKQLLEKTEGHQLLLVENLTPSVVTLLGDHWKVPPDFFLAHLENSNWYSLQDISQNLPALRSAHQSHVRFQFVAPREFDIESPDCVDCSSGILCRDKEDLRPDSAPRSLSQPTGPKTWNRRLLDRMEEDKRTASVPRIAGGFIPTTPPQDDVNGYKIPTGDSTARTHAVAFVRNSVTIWFDNLDHPGDSWRKGVILFDPPFKAGNPMFAKKENSKYRSFMPRRAPPHFDQEDIDPRDSYKDSFIKCLERNKDIQTGGVPRTFVLLQDLCRIIASEWLVFNSYIERELNNIERYFEDLGVHCKQEGLEYLLSQLMCARRRVTKYETLVSDQLQLCPEQWRHAAPNRGTCPSVSSTAHSHTSFEFPSTLADFHQVNDHFAHNKIRISQAIKVVTSLMAVHLNNLTLNQNKELVHQSQLAYKQNKLALARNASLAFLTVVTSFILPFTAVAGIMAIPRDTGLGPDGKSFWKFWVSGGVTASLLVLSFFSAREYEFRKAECGRKSAEKAEHDDKSGVAKSINTNEKKGKTTISSLSPV